MASGKSYDADSRDYACYVLALAGTPDRGDMNRLREDLAKLPESSALLLAGAYVLDGKKDVARNVLQGKKAAAAGYDRFSANFDSEERVYAIAAMVHSAVGDKAAAFKDVEKLSSWLNDRKHYMSTQSTSWALRAVADYMKNNAADGLNVSVKAGHSSSTLKGNKAIAQGSLDAGNGSSLDLEISNSAKAPVYVVVSSTGVPEKGEEVARADGLQLSVKYTLPDGTPIDPSQIDQGTDFLVYTYITNTSSTTDYTNLALTQIFPSGWEIHVDRIEGFYQDFRDDRIYSYLYQGRNSTSYLKTRVTATYKGRFYLPSVVCEAMYDNTVGASVPGRWVEVK